jgi:hypothetical protein
MNLKKLLKIAGKVAPVVIANAPVVIAVVKEVKRAVKKPKVG